MKIVTLALAMALSIVLAGCGDEKKPDAAKGAAPGATTAAAAKSAAPAAKPSSTAGGGW